MAASEERVAEAEIGKAIAPWWHTALLAAIFLAVTVGGALSQGQVRPHPGPPESHLHLIPLYLFLIAMEWALVFYVRKGIRRKAMGLGDLIGPRWSTWKDMVRDLALGLGFWFLWSVGDIAWVRLVRAGRPAAVDALLPHRQFEILLWVLLSISAGVCEEVVFRGYFQAQFRVLARSAPAAILLQAVLFGISHGYQGTQATAQIAVYGALLGCLAIWRGSLRPGMIAHAWTDIFSGLVAG